MPNPLHIYIYIKYMICKIILLIINIQIIEHEVIYFYMLTVKWFLAFLSNTNYSIYY